MHALEDPGDSELPALSGGEVLKTLKIVGKEVRLSSKIAKAGMDRLADALTTVRHLASALVSFVQCCIVALVVLLHLSSCISASYGHAHSEKHGNL